MSNSKKEILAYLDNVTLFLWSAVLFAFPFIFTSVTTDAFTFPKQIIFAGVVVLSFILQGLKMILQGKVTLRSTPFDLPLLVFALVLFLSAFFAVNKYDAYISFVPVLFVILAYYAIVNLRAEKTGLLFMLGALVAGTAVNSVFILLTFLKLYVLPFQYTHVNTFSTFGSLLDQAIYLALALPIAGYIAYPLLAPKTISGKDVMVLTHNKNIAYGFVGAMAAIIVGLGVTLYLLVFVQKPLILPFETGFQTAFAVISQDAGNVFKSFLVGSGFGTYLTDFTRFKQAAYNANPTLWSFTFFRSSSFVLELIATTGILGLASFGFIIYRVIKEKVFFLPLILAIVASFLLPFSFTLIALLFILLAMFATMRAIQNPHHYGEMAFYFVALKQGLFAVDTDTHQPNVFTNSYAKVLPVIFFIVVIGGVGSLAYFTTRYIVSDVTFQRSLVAAAQNNGAATYDLQNKAIGMFPYRDSYYRIFSQTNLALANSLASIQPEGASPSAEVQNQIIALIQNAITSGRAAVTVSPQTALNWNNLSSIYRSLIGFGQNADRFAVLTNQQAIALDANNPQQYITLGGIYYQLGLWDDAQRQFATAVQLKSDYANAYYNLGHAFESKGDLTNAVAAYRQVKVLVAQDTENVKKIEQEITAVEKKIGDQANNAAAPQVQTPGVDANQPLGVSQPTTQLPERNPRVQIPAPTISPLPSPTNQPTTTVTPTQQVSPTPAP